MTCQKYNNQQGSDQTMALLLSDLTSLEQLQGITTTPDMSLASEKEKFL